MFVSKAVPQKTSRQYTDAKIQLKIHLLYLPIYAQDVFDIFKQKQSSEYSETFRKYCYETTLPL